jgi:hypothetical protein
VVAGERERGQRVGREHPHLQHLRSRARPAAVGELRLVGDTDHAGRASLGDVIDADEPGQLDGRADLLHAFARSRLPRALVIVYESARKAPEAEARLDRAATQQDAAVDLDHHRRRDLGVVPEHEVVLGTGFDIPPLDDACHKPSPALQAVVPHQLHSRCLS